MLQHNPLKEVAGTGRWDVPAGVLATKQSSYEDAFLHQFEDHLVISDDQDGISVWIGIEREGWHDSVQVTLMAAKSVTFKPSMKTTPGAAHALVALMESQQSVPKLRER